jgi:hypothetical protein
VAGGSGEQNAGRGTTKYTKYTKKKTTEGKCEKCSATVSFFPSFRVSRGSLLLLFSVVSVVILPFSRGLAFPVFGAVGILSLEQGVFKVTLPGQ